MHACTKRRIKDAYSFLVKVAGAEKYLSLVWNEVGEKKKSDGPWPTNISVTNTTQILKKRRVEFTTKLRIIFHSTHSCLIA